MTNFARRCRTVGLLLVTATLAAACSSGGGTDEPSPTTTSSSATYELPPRPVRPDEVPLRDHPVMDGDTSFSLIGLSTDMPSLIGSHAEMEAQNGQFIRVRLVVLNMGRSTVLFNAMRQQLILTDGKTVTPNEPAMLVKRQPDQFNLGANVRVEFDLYYDVAKTAKAKALRAFGGATLTDAKDAEGTDIPLVPAHKAH
jgi:uncharacterized protein DUF4352